MVTTSGPAQDDVQLLRDVSDGDRAALQALYDRHAPWLLLRLRGRCGDPSIVDEAVQDTFLAVWRRAGAYRGDGEVAAWLWGIAIRRLLDHLRAAARTPLPRESSDRDTVVSAEEHVLAGVEHGDLAGALASLSPELRAVVQATVLDGLTHREAARLLGIPTGTVKSRMMRARVQLREALA